jgi:uncharacterized membrane protein
VSLDTQITDAFALLGLLLAFLFGYFAAVFPLVQALLDQPRPEAKDDRQALAGQLGTYRVLVSGILLLIVATAVVVAPLTWKVLAAVSVHRPYSTLRAGLLLIGLMLLALLGVTGWLWGRLHGRITKLRA